MLCRLTISVIEQLKTETGNSKVYFLYLDLANSKTLRPCVETFLLKEKQLHLMILNAGVMLPAEGKTTQGYEPHWGVNVVGHFGLQQLLMPTILSTAQTSKQGSVRICWLSSNLYTDAPKNLINFDDVNLVKHTGMQGGILKYGQSKAANILLAKETGSRYGKDNIISLAVHPGLIKSSLQRDFNFIFTLFMRIFAWDPRYGPINTLFASTSPVINETWNGAYIVPWTRRGALQNENAFNGPLQKRLWEYLERETERII